MCYFGLIANIFLNELKSENNLEYKINVLEELLFGYEMLFIQANLSLKLRSEDFVLANTTHLLDSLDKLPDYKLLNLEVKTDKDWIKETLIYTFEFISILYIQNLINEKEVNNKKDETKCHVNVRYSLKSFFEKFVELFENLCKKKTSKRMR